MPNKNPEQSVPYFLQDGGKTGELIRAIDWSKHPLGLPENWPSALKYSVSMMFSSALPVLICWGPEYLQLYNDNFRPINGEAKHPQALGNSAKITYAEIWDAIGPMFADVMNGQTFGFPDFKVRLDRNSGAEDCYFDFSYSPIKNDDGTVAGILVICVETTAKINALNKLGTVNDELRGVLSKLKETENNLRAVISQAPVAMAIFRGANYVVEIVNNRALELWGRNFDEVDQKPILEAMPELEPQGIKQLLDDVYLNGNSFAAAELPVQLLRDDDLETVYVNFVYEPLYDAAGNVNGVITIGFDVTEAVLIRRKTEDSESKLDQVIDLLPAAITILMGPDLVIERTNPSNLAYWQKTKAQTFGKPLLEVLPELKNQAFPGQLRYVLETGETIVVHEGEVKLEDADGNINITYVDYSYQPLTDQNGHNIGVLVMSNDVTEKVISRRLLEASEGALQAMNEELAATNEELFRTIDKLQVSEENFRNIISQAPVAMCLLIGADHVIELVNDAMVEIWGKPLAEVINKPVFKALPDAREQGLEQVMAAVYHTGTPFMANEQPVSLLRHGKEEIVYQNFVYQPYKDNNGNVLGVLAISVNVTEQVLARQKIEQSEAELLNIKKQLEAELETGKQLQQQKDGFIGMASHELKTPLTSLSAIIQVAGLKLKHSNDNFLKEAMDKANAQVKKMNALINGFLNISRLESGKILIEKTDFELKKLLKEVISEHELTVSSHIIELPACDNVTLNADRDKIGSVISNLLSNAVKYSPKGKNILVRCQAMGTHVQVSVKDEGMGIKSGDLSKVFDRYYRVQTTHTQHISGFGIGLYLSAEIIHRHDGEIWVESESGKGSTFYFSLPIR